MKTSKEICHVRNNPLQRYKLDWIWFVLRNTWLFQTTAHSWLPVFLCGEHCSVPTMRICWGGLQSNQILIAQGTAFVAAGWHTAGMLCRKQVALFSQFFRFIFVNLFHHQLSRNCALFVHFSRSKKKNIYICIYTHTHTHTHRVEGV